ncbi:fungal-specific transcription factor domain-containing protein [Bombardia bombarda]|uniref:Fungal-specific transcription factor domain-containing protein n=1 Tax=Bombardia bombarda TaxID=252184 RepID=A0AA39XLB6_9PEZI|nr:fungal-specific transcription factor domain-containing protein [Bombardia bombarda]
MSNTSLASASPKSIPLPAGTGDIHTSHPKKTRSCVTCSTRKVRCDKASPCSNCQRAAIACVYPATGRPPRWARRFNRPLQAAAQQETTTQLVSSRPQLYTSDRLFDRLQKLEHLVKELSSQIEQNTISDLAGAAAALHKTPKSLSSDGQNRDQADSLHTQFGRLVIRDEASQSRYVSSGFWSRINDELDTLKADAGALAEQESDISDYENSPGKSSNDTERTASERHAFLFGHNLGSPSPASENLHPASSHVMELLRIFKRSANDVIQIVHMPTVVKMASDMNSSGLRPSPSNEAVLFAIYYAAITSMEEEDVQKQFESSRTDLRLRYRVALEHALAKADFLNTPDLQLVQAFTIFLFLARLDESPGFIWMMTGLVIRMAQALGLHRNGANLKHLTPYEVEIRHRVWWVLCVLDVRSSEDQGTDLTISQAAFDTDLPRNVNDADINPDSKHEPPEREGFTDTAIALYSFEICKVARKMMAHNSSGGLPDLDDVRSMLDELRDRPGKHILHIAAAAAAAAAESQSTTSSPDLAIIHWVSVTVLRLVIAKMSLLMYLPALFPAPDQDLCDTIRARLFTSAIENAEYNHALNSEPGCHHWRWLFLTHTHWHAIVFLLLEITRRPWSPTSERAWVALQSKWLIPEQSSVGTTSLRVWIPLKRLIVQAKRYRARELERLRGDPQGALLVESEDAKMSAPAVEEPFPDMTSVGLFRERWRMLVSTPASGSQADKPVPEGTTMDSSMAVEQDIMAEQGFEYDEWAGHEEQGGPTPAELEFAMETMCAERAARGSFQAGGQPSPIIPPQDGRFMGPGLTPWLWADADPSVDVFGDIQLDSVETDMNMDDGVDWLDWFGSLRDVEAGGRSTTT